MHIYLVRHGIAEDAAATQTGRDSERGLSGRGFERTRAAARGAAVLGVRPDSICCSTLIRARQTAEIFSTALGGAPVETVSQLDPESDAGDMLLWLAKRPRNESVMLVGHMPSLAILVAVLVCGTDDNLLHLKKAGLCRLTLDDGILPGTANLDWLLPPNVLRRLRSPD